MVRTPFKKDIPAAEPPQAPQQEVNAPVRIEEREINLSLINDKLNYAIGLLHKIAEAAEIDLETKEQK